MDNALLREDFDGVIALTLNRPDKLNAITPAMLEGISLALAELRDNNQHRVLLIKATGRYFSAGMDISAGMAPAGDSGVEFRRWYRTSLHSLFDEIEAVEKPVVLAAHGPCLGGALEMACSCDFRLAAASAKFSLPEVRLGLIPGSGGTSRLTRLVGSANAKWLVMAGQEVSAERALQMGLVQEVCSDDQFDQRCRQFCTDLANLPEEASAMAKITIDTVADLDRTGARQVERIANTFLTRSQEHRSIMDAFVNRKNDANRKKKK